MAHRPDFYRLSRRGLLKVSAGTMVVGALAATLPESLSAAPSPFEPSTPGFAQQARTVAVNASSVDVVTLTTMQHMSVPIVGFPLPPRVGDLVTVTDRVPGHTLAALPLCKWVTGVPTQRGDLFEIGSAIAADSPRLHGLSTAVSVCLEDSTLPDREVLAVRG